MTLPASVGQSGELHFGIIKAIEKKLDKLKKKADIYSELPDISTFISQKSNRFIVNIEDINDGHPLKGRRAKTPHCGAHVDFDEDEWPKGGSAPENYPHIYAPVDGIVYRVDYVYHLELQDRYGFDIAFAKDNDGYIYILSYGVEPMVFEPSENLYRSFILITEGQKVKKGDIIAYAYTETGKGPGTHIHFHIVPVKKGRGGNFMAPAIFTKTLVDQFQAKWDLHKNDNGDPMPPCMGYKLEADENPFGTGAIDILW